MPALSDLVQSALAAHAGTGRKTATRKWGAIVDDLQPFFTAAEPWTAAKVAEWAVKNTVVTAADQSALRHALSRRLTQINRAKAAARKTAVLTSTLA